MIDRKSSGSHEGPGEATHVGLSTTQKPLRLIRIADVMSRTGLAKSTIYELHRNGQFPRNVKITERAVGWIEEDIDRWLAQRLGDRAGS